VEVVLANLPGCYTNELAYPFGQEKTLLFSLYPPHYFWVLVPF